MSTEAFHNSNIRPNIEPDIEPVEAVTNPAHTARTVSALRALSAISPNGLPAALGLNPIYNGARPYRSLDINSQE